MLISQQERLNAQLMFVNVEKSLEVIFIPFYKMGQNRQYY
jgi:hypothetical protein